MKQEEILFLLGSACIVIFVWIAFTIVHTSLTSTISTSAMQAITPIGGSFDTKTISAMNSRKQITPLTVIQPYTQTEIVVTTAPTPTNQPTPATTTAQGASQEGSLQ